jgi:hypothetical protein
LVIVVEVRAVIASISNAIKVRVELIRIVIIRTVVALITTSIRGIRLEKGVVVRVSLLRVEV